MASIPFGIEFDRIAPPVRTIAAAAEYDAARRRRTIDFFFERLRPRCIGRLQRLDGDPATGWNRRERVIHQALAQCCFHLSRPSFPHWRLTLRALSVVPQRRRRGAYHTAPPA